MLNSIVILIGLATLIYSGVWMSAAPSKALMVVNKVRNEVGRFDRNIFREGTEPIHESGPMRVAFRFVGLALVLLSLFRLTEIT
jgi:hypothetical protein